MLRLGRWACSILPGSFFEIFIDGDACGNGTRAGAGAGRQAGSRWLPDACVAAWLPAAAIAAATMKPQAKKRDAMRDEAKQACDRWHVAPLLARGWELRAHEAHALQMYSCISFRVSEKILQARRRALLESGRTDHCDLQRNLEAVDRDSLPASGQRRNPLHRE